MYYVRYVCKICMYYVRYGGKIPATSSDKPVTAGSKIKIITPNSTILKIVTKL